MDLNNLPLELEMIQHVFTYLNADDLCRLTSQVCTKWKYLSYDPILWKNVILDSDRHSPNEIALVVDCSSMTHRFVFSKITNWEFITPFPSCDYLRKIEFNSCDLSGSIVMQLATAFPLIDSVRLMYEKFDSFVVQQILLWQFLKDIEIRAVNVYTERDGVGDICLNLITRNCKYLENLDIEKLTVSDGPLLNFTKSKGLMLKKFKVCLERVRSQSYSFLPYCRNVTHLELHSCYFMTGIDLMQLKEFESLEILALIQPHSVETEDFENLFREHSFLKLVDLTLNSDNYSLDDDVCELIPKSCPALRRICFYYCEKVSDLGIQHIVNNLCNIENLILKNSCITGTSLVDISTKLPNLVFLDVSGCSQVDVFTDANEQLIMSGNVKVLLTGNPTHFFAL